MMKLLTAFLIAIGALASVASAGTVPYGGHWYEAVYTPNGTSWTSARDAAVAAGGYLATIGDSAENSFVFGLVSGIQYWFGDGAGNSQGPYIGGYQDFKPVAATWGTGDHWNWTAEGAWGSGAFTNWETANLEPNDAPTTLQVEDNEENYLQFFNKGVRANTMPIPDSTWNDIDNSSPVKGYIIEWSVNPQGVPLPASGWMALGLLSSLAALRKVRRRRS